VDEGRPLERALKQPVVVLVKLDPERSALQVLNPPGPQEAIPVFAHPATDRRLAEVATRPHALDPLELLRFFLAAAMDTLTDIRTNRRRRRRHTLGHRDLRGKPPAPCLNRTMRESPLKQLE